MHTVEETRMYYLCRDYRIWGW